MCINSIVMSDQDTVKFILVVGYGFSIPISKISDIDIDGIDLENVLHSGLYCFRLGDILYIRCPESHSELKKFVEIFHPNLNFSIMWQKKYGCNNWRKMHGISMIRSKRCNTKKFISHVTDAES